jgi:predicted P-loop ATPase
MGGPWFSDSVTTVNDNKALEGLQGSWIIEMGELAGLRKAEVDAVKHFVAKKEDRYRVAYGKRISYFPRQCVFGGTTNEDDPLRDATGNRRYWVVNCKGGRIELPVGEYLTPGIVSQISAEAKEHYANG